MIHNNRNRDSFLRFQPPFFAASHLIPALSFSLFHACSRSFNSFHSIVLSYHTPQKCTFCFYYAFFLLLLRVSVFLLSLLFSLLFVFFVLIKDNSNNNCFFWIFFVYFPPTFSLFAVCVFSLSFLLYCMVYYKKLFTSCFEPSQLALPAFFSLFLFEIYHWIINFKFYPPLTNLSHSLQLPSILLTLTLILNLPSRYCCCCCCPKTFIIVFAFLLCFCFSL